MNAPWSEQRVAIVTGGGSGIGTAISVRLASDGAAVVIFDRNLEPAQAVADEIVRSGGRAIAVSVDVSSREQIDAGVVAAHDAFGPVTILVNNAGISPFVKFAAVTHEHFEQVMNVNVRGTIDCSQAVLADMVAARWGRIVNISSSSAQTGNALHTVYSASKGAVIALTRSMARELGPKGITVNTIPPSFVETPSLAAAADEGYLGAGIEQHVPSTPVRRVGQPEDIASACAFLVRDDAGYVTGQVIGVNGGRVIG